MRIIICGAGRVGKGIAQHLAAENQVTVVDEQSELIDSVVAQYEVAGIVGHAAYPSTLKRAGAESAEMIIAVTHSDEVNMITCQIAHSLFKIPNKIARIRSQEYLKSTDQRLFSDDNLPIDLRISPEVEVGKSIIRRYLTPGAFLTTDLAKGKLKFIGVEIPENSGLAEATLKDATQVFKGEQLKIVGIARRVDGETKLRVPRENDTLHAGDRIYCVCSDEAVEKLFLVLDAGQNLTEQSQSVLIVGGGNIGLYVAKHLEKLGLSVRLVERDEKRAEFAAEQLRRSIVIHGEGLSHELLEEAGVGPDTTVIGLTSDDKSNLLLGSLAKSLRARKVVALVNEQDLAQIGPDLNVDVVVDPRSITVSRILLRLRQGRLTNLQTVEGGLGEVVEGEVRETSRLIGMVLSDEAELSDGLIAGALVRDDKVISLDERVKQGDIVVMFNEHDKSRQTDLLYRVKPQFY